MSSQAEEIMDIDDSNIEDPVVIPEINDYQENENHYIKSSPIGSNSYINTDDKQEKKDVIKDTTMTKDSQLGQEDKTAIKEVTLTAVGTNNSPGQNVSVISEQKDDKEIKQEEEEEEQHQQSEEEEEEEQLQQGEEREKEQNQEENEKLHAGDALHIVSRTKTEGGEWVPMEVEILHHLDILIHDEKKSDITGVLEASVKAQETMGEGLLERIVFDAEVLKTVYNHFYARARASESYATAAGTLPPTTSSTQNLLGTSLENGLEYLKRIGRTESDGFFQMGKFLHDICKELLDLQTELLADHKRRAADNAQLVRCLHSQLEVVLSSYNAAMSGLEATQKNVKGLAQPSAKDPWILQLKYYGTLTRLNALQAEYSSHLANLAKHAKEQELRQCNLIESVSKRFLAFENTVFTKIITDIQIAADMFSKIDPEKDWDIFIKGHPLSKFIPEDGLDKECVKRCIPYYENMRTDSDSTSSLSVIRCGEMEYGGLVSWKRYIAVLTNFGFLHLFAKKKSESGILPPSSSKLSTSHQGKGTQDIVADGAQEKLKESKEAENNSGTNGRSNDSTLIPTEDPQITIPITRCKMAVTESNTIRMTHIVPGTFFNSTATHDIRLGSTDDLVAWMIDLRHFMSPGTTSK